MPVADFFWGERYGVIQDPFGHRWAVTTEHEDLSPDELSARASAYLETADLQAPADARGSR